MQLIPINEYGKVLFWYGTRQSLLLSGASEVILQNMGEYNSEGHIELI